MNPTSDSDGGGAPATGTPAQPAQPTAPPPSSPPNDPAAELPAAAQVVMNGSKTEREIQLEQELQAERMSRRKIECDNAQLQDELHRLVSPAEVPIRPASTAVPPARERTKCKRGPLGVRTN